MRFSSADNDAKYHKGFRVELDGISATLSSAPSVSRAVVLLIDGQVHGFICPSRSNVKAVLKYTQSCQPYYAVPSRLHSMDEFPITRNGKIDKKALRTLASPQHLDKGDASLV